MALDTARSDLKAAIAAFQARGSGRLSFESFSADCNELARRDPLNAGFYAMLSALAQLTIEQQEAQLPELGRNDDAKMRIVSYAERVVASFSLAPEAKLALLNDLGHALVSGR